MSRIVFLAARSILACLIALNGDSAQAADAPERRETPIEQANARTMHELAWLEPANHVRPHKGFRADARGTQVPALLWVAYRENGQPLAVDQFQSARVNSYFHARLEAKLTQGCEQYRLPASSTDKLRLAGKLDIARLDRLARQVDELLREPGVKQDPREVNKLMHSLAMACDQELFEKDSLFQRVLATQLSLQRKASE